MVLLLIHSTCCLPEGCNPKVPTVSLPPVSSPLQMPGLVLTSKGNQVWRLKQVLVVIFMGMLSPGT